GAGALGERPGVAGLDPEQADDVAFLIALRHRSSGTAALQSLYGPRRELDEPGAVRLANRGKRGEPRGLTAARESPRAQPETGGGGEAPPELARRRVRVGRRGWRTPRSAPAAGRPSRGRGAPPVGPSLGSTTVRRHAAPLDGQAEPIPELPERPRAHARPSLVPVLAPDPALR